MKAPTVKIDPVAESLARSLFGIEMIPAGSRDRIIMRAVKESRKAMTEELVGRIRDNAGKFISDRAMEMFIEEVTK